MTEQKLIDAALLHYSLYGYHGATMRKIATEVGIKPGSIYFFFESKEKLFVAAFIHLLNRHQTEMERIFKESYQKDVKQILISLTHGIVAYHKGDKKGTMAYISLVTSPIPEIKKHLQNHMNNFNVWLTQSLKNLINSVYKGVSEKEVSNIVDQYVLLANGVFWSLNIHDEEFLKNQLKVADNFIQMVFKEIDYKYLN